MKGIVFTEFLEMVEEGHGIDMVDNLIESCDLPSGGVYTAVGAYEHTELVAMVIELSKRTEIEVPVLIKAFGHHLHKTFSSKFPAFYEEKDNAFDFLSGVENHIHVEVRKLYPDAQLPTFDISQPDEKTLVMDYHSARHFEDLAEGLIEGTLQHFEEEASIAREPIEGTDDTRFTITRLA